LEALQIDAHYITIGKDYIQDVLDEKEFNPEITTITFLKEMTHEILEGAESDKKEMRIFI
jgi:hypothetical protein